MNDPIGLLGQFRAEADEMVKTLLRGQPECVTLSRTALEQALRTAFLAGITATVNAQEKTIRPIGDIVLAHDRIAAICDGDVEIKGYCEHWKRFARLQGLVLCWVLRHDHQDQFTKLLAGIDREFKAQGIIEIQAGNG
jgi:hypothetical protein